MAITRESVTMVTQDKVQQHITRAIRKADLSTVTAKQIRRIVENELDLGDGELSSERWKGFVKSVIEETMAGIERGQEGQRSEESEDERPKKVKRKKGVIKDTPPSSPSSPVKPKIKSSPTSPSSPSRKQGSHPVQQEGKPRPMKKRKTSPEGESDSDMSVLIDSTPPDAKSRKQTSKAAPKPKKESKKPKPNDSTISTKEDEVKKLKSLVHQCGVRKIWSKELPSSMSASEQISHLKTLLNSLGMTGRLSAEKAKKIKAERELKDELEFIQEGAKNLGEGHRRRD